MFDASLTSFSRSVGALFLNCSVPPQKAQKADPIPRRLSS